MTVRELIECSYFVKNVEIEVRDNGKWIQGYRIGRDAEIYIYEECAEYQEYRGRFGIAPYKLKPGEEADVFKWTRELPMKIMCIDPKKAPKKVLDLRVNHYQPRHIPYFHGDSLTHNDFDLNIVAYPPEEGKLLEPEPKEAKKDDIDGQLCLDEFFEKEQI